MPPQMIISDPVHTAVYWPWRFEGQAPPVDMVFQVSVAGSYRPPVVEHEPAQMIISLPVQTDFVSMPAGVGQLGPVEVNDHVSEIGSYNPPVFEPYGWSVNPPQTIILVPVHTAVCRKRPSGQLGPVEVGDHESVAGL